MIGHRAYLRFGKKPRIGKRRISGRRARKKKARRS
jgi:hypothetical protein